MPLTGLQLRRGRVTDAPAISKAIIRALHQSNAADYSPDTIARVVESFSPEKIRALMAGRHVFVALLNGKLIGTASLQGSTAKTVFVHPDHQGKGVGASLMQVVEQAAIANGQSVLHVPSSITAEGFYRNLGFVAVRDEFHGEERTIIMQKPIAD